MTNYSISKLGLSQTAITACFSGPSFDILLGMGSCFIFAAMVSPYAFPLFTHKIIFVSWCFFLANSSIAILLVVLRRGELNKFNAYFHIAIYVLYVVMLVVATFGS